MRLAIQIGLELYVQSGFKYISRFYYKYKTLYDYNKY